jgi:hypothetical protein
LEVRGSDYSRCGGSQRAASVFLFVLAACGATAARAQDPLAALGMQRAAASALQWEVRDASHPALGPIRFAMLATPIATTVGSNAISSNIYVSCERNARRIAIELTNSRAPDDPGGFRPKTMPRLVCNGVDPSRADRTTAEPLHASWSVNELGDAMARGLWPSQLRQCASIGITQEVALPKGWTRESARIELEITSYARALDQVFEACGEPSVLAGASAAAHARIAEPFPPAKIAGPATSANERPWKPARVVVAGHTEVRTAPRVDADVVATLDPGAGVRVQFAGGNWWRVKPQSGASFEGYIRRERIIFR